MIPLLTLSLLLLASTTALCDVDVDVSNGLIYNSTRIRTVGPGFNLTKEEDAALDQFEPMVSHLLYLPQMHSDNFLIKFLRAQNLDLTAAAAMLERTLEWRKSNKIDSILSEDLSRWEKLFPFVQSGEDRGHRPIFYIFASAHDTRKAVLAGHYNTLVRLYDQSYERAVQVGLRIYEGTGENVALEGILIIDLSGFSLRKQACLACLPLYAHVVQSYEAYYPQTLYKILVINAAPAFENVLKLMRPFMSEHTRRALEVYSFDKDMWRPVLLKYIDPGQLLDRFGGTRKLDKETSLTLGRR